MAEGNVDLPEDLGPVTKLTADPWAAKDYVSGGNDQDNVLVVLDDSKDQAASENNIPLSPQWLYAKPSDSKIGLSATPGDTRPPNSLPQGALVDSVQRDAWRLEGSQDKKDWRRNVPDVESNRRWREEERETGLLGRRERRKEGDRENEYRKNDRRSDSAPMRELVESRTLPSSDRWHEVASRNPGHESRRDSKWSSRWGPEDKEKDSRVEKKTDGDKEDPHAEKQPIIAGDKWRPQRQRQEIHPGGSAVYRAAPGFGAERGRGEGPNIGFALGRGRSNFAVGLPSNRFSSPGPIGAAPSIKSESLHGKSHLIADTFRYPRGKLLDIYRTNNMLSAFNSTLEGFEEVPQITQSSSMAPLAFIKPDLEEVAALEDIWKGKVMSSDVCCDSNGERMERVGDHEIEPDVRLCKNKVSALSNGKDPDSMTSAISKDDACSIVLDDLSHFEKKDDQSNMKNTAGYLEFHDFLGDDKFGAINPTDSLDIYIKLPDDSSSLFNASIIQSTPDSDNQQQNNNPETELMEHSTSTGSSLFYLDPQGNIQGPFLAEDIITWHGEGFFGTDLPVVLADSPEDTPFRPLGEVIPDLNTRLQFTPLTNSGEQSDRVDATRGNLEATLASEFSSSFTLGDQQLTSSGPEDPLLHHVQPRISEPEVSIASQYEKSPVSNSDILGGIPGVGRQNYHDFSGQDAEEVLYMGRSANSIQDPLGKLGNEIHDMSRTSSGHQFLMSEMGQPMSANQKVPIDNLVNPLGLSWSELEGTHHKGPLSSNISGVGDLGRINSPLLGGDASLFRHKQEQFSVKGDSVVHDAWSGNYRRNTSSNVLQDVMDASRFNLEEHLLSQFQKQERQHQHLLTPHQNMHPSGSYMEQLQGPLHHQQSINQSIDMERLLKLQLQQQRHLQQLEQQQQLHQQQQQIHHRMQLLQEQHQRQQHQLLLEQFLHQQHHDPRENTFDQVLYRQRRLHELQQAHHLPVDHDLSLDQIIQAKFGHNLPRERHSELFDALPHPSHRHMLPLEQKLLLDLQQEQLQSRQFPTASRHQPGMDDERHVGGVWSVDESGQFVRAAATPHQTHSSRLNQLDFVQPLQRPSSFEQPHYLERNFLLHDRMQRENYGLNSQHLERSSGTPRPNMDLMSAVQHLQGMDVLENHGHMSSPVQMGQFPSGSRSQQNWMPNQFTKSHVGAMERNWSESNGQLQNSLVESQLNQIHLASEKQKRDMQAEFSLEDPNRWASHVRNESSNLGLADLLHEKLSLQTSQPLGWIDGSSTSSYKNREPSWPFSLPATEHSLNLAVDKRVLGDSFAEGSLFTKSGQTHQEHSTDLNLEGQVDTFHSIGSLPFRSSSGALAEHQQFFPDISENEKDHIADLTDGGAWRDGTDLSELKEGMRVRQHGSKSIATSRYALEGSVEQAAAPVLDHVALKAKGPARHASFGGTGGGASLYNYDTGADNAFFDEMVNDRMSERFSRGSDSSLLKRTTHEPHLLSPHGALSEQLLPVPPMNVKSSTSLTAYSDEVRQDPGGNLGDPNTSSSTTRKDTRFSRTSSYSDAEATETSFIDMLKGGTRKQQHMPDAPDTSSGAAEPHDAAGSVGRSSSKKKGKKGRQIDPSLLGFKVHSNRMLMGEIQRPDD